MTAPRVPRLARRRSVHERFDHFRHSGGPDDHRHAGIHRPGSDGTHLSLCLYRGAHRIGGPQALHRHREVRNHGDPLLHSGRKLPDPWRGGATHDQFRYQHGGSLSWRPGSGGRLCLRPLCRRFRILAGDRGGHWYHPAAGHGQAGLSDAFRRRHHRQCRRPGHPDPTLHRHGDVRRLHQFLGGGSLYCRPPPGVGAGADARLHHLVYRPPQRLSALEAGQLGGAPQGFSQFGLGPVADRARHGRHLFRHLHTHRGGGHERRLRLLHRRLRLQGPDNQIGWPRPAGLGQYVGYAALHHHQRRPLLLHPDLRKYPPGPRSVAGGDGAGADRLPGGGESYAAPSGQHHGAFLHHSDHGPHPLSRGDGPGD